MRLVGVGVRVGVGGRRPRRSLLGVLGARVRQGVRGRGRGTGKRLSCR